MALLITGATGHVGLTLATLAGRAGIDVVAQHRSPVSQAQKDRAGPRVRWVRAALDDHFSLAALAAECGIDGAIHDGPEHVRDFIAAQGFVVGHGDSLRNWRVMVNKKSGSAINCRLPSVMFICRKN